MTERTLEVYSVFFTFITLVAKITYDIIKDKSRRLDEDRKREWDIQDRELKACESAARAGVISQKIDENTIVSIAAAKSANKIADKLIDKLDV